MSRMRILVPMIAMIIVAVPSLQAQSQGDVRLPTPFSQAVAAIEQEDYPRARTLLHDVVRDDSTNAEAWYAMGYVGQMLKDDAMLLDASKRFATLSPERIEGWMWQVIVYNNRRQFDSIATPAMKVLAIDPEQAKAANLLPLLAALSLDDVGRRDSTFVLPSSGPIIQLPASWSLRSESTKHSLDWFISLEPVQSATDVFTTGVSAHWYKNISKALPIGNNTDAEFLIGFWRGYVAAMKKDLKPYYKQRIDSTDIQIGDWKGEMITEDLQLDERTYRLRKFDIVLARQDEVVSLILECPIDYWTAYERRFRQAIRTIRLPE